MVYVDAARHSPEEQTEIKIGIARKLLTRSPVTTVSALSLAFFSAIILSFQAPIRDLAVWLSAVLAIAALPPLYIYIQSKHPFSAHNVDRYLLANTFATLCSGLAWGIGMATLADPSSFFCVVITFLVIMAYSTGAIVSHGYYLPSYLAAAGTALLIYGVSGIAADRNPGFGFGIAAVATLPAYFLLARYTHRIVVANILARRQQQLLVDELKAQRDEIDKINQNKTRFLAATSHDLAQPLHAQGNYIAALRSRLTTTDQLDLLDKIEASWRGIGALLDGLVDISRLDSGAVVVHREPVDLGRLAAAVMDEFAVAAREKSIALTSDLEAIATESDSALLARVLRNALSNAIKFTPPNGRVHVSLKEQDGRAVLTVDDDGVGIAADKQLEVFEEYVQLHNPERDRQKGLGLGLSIIRRLCTLLDIQLQFRSEPGSGTRISFLMDKSPAGAATSELHSTSLDALRQSVLIVDNERSVLESMSLLLSDWGCEVYSAGSIDEAILLLKTLGLTPDVLVVDMRLRGEQTGVQCVDRLRRLTETDIPALIMTGNVDGAGSETLPTRTRLLMKPVEASPLHAAIRQLPAGGSGDRVGGRADLAPAEARGP